MKLLLLLLLGAATPLDIPATQYGTGVNGLALSQTPKTIPIDMWAAATVSNQLELSLAVTPGTTASVVVKCQQSATAAANSWSQITLCDGNASANCDPDKRTYPLANYDLQGTVKNISSNWKVTKRYVQCSADDPLDGTGTVVITGTRSWQ